MASDKLTWVELRKAVAETANTSEQEAGQFLNALLDAILTGLKEDKQVKVKGIGTFALKAVAPRKSVNIATGETITIEGYNEASWVCMDYGPVIVHIFNREARNFYNLEKLWNEATEVDISDIITED